MSAFRDDALGSDDATAVAQRIASGEVSPTEVMAAALDRVHAVEPQLRGIAWPDFERARARAEGPAPEGPFGGVPTLVKDNVSMAGLPQCDGSRAVPAVPREHDGAFVQQFLSLGLLPIGKSAMPEFGLSASTEYVGRAPVRNPWNPAYSAGASSGGAAALVAAGVVPLAHANDGGGSIRIPAAACGLVGLKPSRDRLRTDEGHDRMPVRIVTEGVVARSVRDVAGFFTGAERVWRNPRLEPIGQVEAPLARPLRIGVLADSPAAPATDVETRAALADAVVLLGDLGHSIEAAGNLMPRSFARDFASYWGMLAWVIQTRGHTMYPDGFDAAKVEPLTSGLADSFRREMYRAPLVIGRLRATGAAYERRFSPFDVILSPVLAHTTPRLGHLAADQPYDVLFSRMRDYCGFTPLHNAAGAPAISLPMGRTGAGLPIGLQFSGRRGSERLLLELAAQIEEAQPWRRIQDAA